MPLQGDMAENIMPSPDNGCYEVLQSPFGFDALFAGKVYESPNRFFAHWTNSVYFLQMPLFLQNFTNPIDSVYLASGIAKILIQILILYFISRYISNTKNIFSLDFLIVAVLIEPLFQASGYNRYLGIIDQSIVYTLFYALPLGLMLVFLWPFFKALYYKTKLHFSWPKKIIWVGFMVFLMLNGPLLTGVSLVISFLVLTGLWFQNYQKANGNSFLSKSISAIKQINPYILFYFIGISLLSLYSLYLGQLNAFNFNFTLSLGERYAKLPIGLYYLFTQKLGFPLLIFVITLNIVLIKKYYNSQEGKKILRLTRWIGVFALIYIILLPLGGYRIYRPNIIRYDTFMPVTIGFIFVYGFTTLYLIKNIANRFRPYYLSMIVLVLLIFTNADKLKTAEYQCEHAAIEFIAKSDQNPVILDYDCPVMNWSKYNKPEQSELSSKLFYYWHITDEPKQYYFKNPSSE